MSFETLRQDVIGAFKTLHDASYPSVEVEYPNMKRVDIENQTDPWVKVELMVDDKRQMCLGSGAERIRGLLYITASVKQGTGAKWLATYADFLDDNFSLKVVNGLTFREVHPLPGVSYPSWETVGIRLPFTFEFY